MIVYGVNFVLHRILCTGGDGWLLTVEALSEYQVENGNWPQSESKTLVYGIYFYKLNQRQSVSCVITIDF